MNQHDTKQGKLIFIPKIGNPRTVIENKPFALLQTEKRRLIKEPQYEKAKGKLVVKYNFN